jgi:hypothetical protein
MGGGELYACTKSLPTERHFSRVKRKNVRDFTASLSVGFVRFVLCESSSVESVLIFNYNTCVNSFY